VEVGTKGDYIFVRVSNLLLFESGKATVKPEFAALAAEIAAMLNAEAGPIRILGFTDSTQMSGRGQFKSNDELSLARAEGVRDVIAATLTDPARITVEGKGEADPIGDNETEDGRALNRRVEILLAKEGTF
jgi:type VI secretion system protein ImpK